MKTYLLIYGYDEYDYEIKTVEGTWDIGYHFRDIPPIAVIQITKEMLEELKEKVGE